MAISQNAPTQSTVPPTNANDAPSPSDRYALWFFAGTLVLAIAAVAWTMLGI